MAGDRAARAVHAGVRRRQHVLQPHRRRRPAGAASTPSPRRLVPGGRFVLEAFVPDPDEDGDGVRRARRSPPTGSCSLVTPTTSTRRRADGQFVELADGEPRAPAAVGDPVVPRPTQLDAMAAAAGLVLEHRWSDWAGDAVRPRQRPITCRCGAGTRGRRLTQQMSQLRLNPLNGRWVTIVAERAERPTDFAPRIRQVEADPTGPARSARATRRPRRRRSRPTAATAAGSCASCPTCYPAFYGDDPMAVRNLGPVHVQASASGIHEVLVFSPRPRRQLGRPRRPRRRPRHGRPARPHGGARPHPARPLHAGHREPRPRGRARRCRTRTASCSACRSCPARSSTRRRPSPASRAAASCAPPSRPRSPTAPASCWPTTASSSSAPFWSGTPYELLVIPRTHEAHLQGSAPGRPRRRRPRHPRRARPRSRDLLGDVAYNLVFHTAPHHHGGVVPLARPHLAEAGHRPPASSGAPAC